MAVPAHHVVCGLLDAVVICADQDLVHGREHPRHALGEDRGLLLGVRVVGNLEHLAADLERVAYALLGMFLDTERAKACDIGCDLVRDIEPPTRIGIRASE